MDFPTEPLICSPMKIRPDWIDYNGHLNMAYYGVIFDLSSDEIFARLGMGPDYRANRGFTTYSAEFHICYLREVKQGDEVHCSFQLIDHDEKRFHFYQEMFHADGWLAATGEGLGLNIDISGPRVAPMPADIQANFAELSRAHSGLPRPERVGRGIGIRRKS